jgi:glycopeptide antibiotics resistance protein
MVRSKFSVIVALAYTFLIACALLYPRAAGNLVSSDYLILRIFHKILFVSGPLEIFGNFFLFIPVLLALIHAAPEFRVRYMALICCLGSAAVEAAQTWIPGRVSSVRDFVSNTLGVVATLLVMKLNPRLTSWIKGI